MIRGLEPTRVRQPPVIAANPMGIKILLAAMFNSLEMRIVAGRNRAAAPIFCIKLEITDTVDEIMSIIRVSLRPATLII